MPWLAYVPRHCELVPDDRRYLLHHLATCPEAEAMRLAHHYVETWHAAAETEPLPSAKDNRGRTAANRTLLALVVSAGATLTQVRQP